MPGSNSLQIAFKNLIQEAVQELQQESLDRPPEEGSVSAVNADGTVNVVTGSSSYASIGSPVVLTLGQLVIVITAAGVSTAVPR